MANGPVETLTQAGSSFPVQARTISKRESLRIRERLSSKENPRPISRHVENASQHIANKTLLCRQWFGEFVPVIRYPSLRDVISELGRESNAAYFQVSRFDRAILSEVFDDVLRIIASPGDFPDKASVSAKDIAEKLSKQLRIIEATDKDAHDQYKSLASLIENLGEDVDENNQTLPRILQVYSEALSAREEIEKEQYRILTSFEESVNYFLFDKSLTIPKRVDPRGSDTRFIRFDEERTASLHVLSSGERHVISILFSATHLSNNDGIVLVDEPELSLHVDWQRIILGELRRLSDGRQIIACTHSPEVAADHESAMIKLEPKLWDADPHLFHESSENSEEED